MSEGAEAERDVITLELGYLKETLVSTMAGRRGAYKINFKKVGAKVPTSLLWPSLLLPLHGGGGGALSPIVVVPPHCCCCCGGVGCAAAVVVMFGGGGAGAGALGWG